MSLPVRREFMNSILSACRPVLPIPVSEHFSTFLNSVFTVVASMPLNDLFWRFSGALLATTAQYVLPCLMPGREGSK